MPVDSKTSIAMLVYTCAGLIYWFLLRLSLIEDINIGRLLVGLTILSAKGFYILFAATPIALLRKDLLQDIFGRYFLSTTRFSWCLYNSFGLAIYLEGEIYKHHWATDSTALAIVPLITIIVIRTFDQQPHVEYLSGSFNRIICWLALSA